MSYEDLVAAWNKRAAKEQAKATAGPGKHVPKPKKVAVLQLEEQRGEKRRYEKMEGEGAIVSKAKHIQKRKNLIAESERQV